MKRRLMKRILSILLLLCVGMSMVFNIPVQAEKLNTAGPDNGIPVVYLDIDESRGTIYDMLDSADHSVYCYGTFRVEVPEGFHYSDLEDLVCKSIDGVEMSIRGRGNSTWQMAEKKPFKIKLDKKTDVFGLGKNKHWVLVANEFDPSLMRDRITAWLGDEMDFGFTPRGVPVDLVMKGEYYGEQYLGSYYLSENVRVDENRLEIAELGENDTDPDIITGGYLIQNANQLSKDSPDRFRTKRGADWATHTPSFDTEGDNFTDSNEEGEEAFITAELEDAYENHYQQEYIRNYLQEFEDVLFEGNTDYREWMDLESAAKYWLVQTFTLNGDAYITGSTYFYKDRDPENGVSKIYWGPLWDFDYGWNKQKKTYGFPYGHIWIKPMLYDRGPGGFIEEVHKQWPEMRKSIVKLIEDGGIIDQYREETRASALKDIEINHPAADTDYDRSVDELKDWITERLAWVDEHFDEIDDMVHKVTFIVDGDKFRTDFKADTEYIEADEEYPEKEGYIFAGWADEDGNIITGQRYITEDLTVTAEYIPESEASHAEDIACSKGSDIYTYNSHVSMYQIQYTVIPTDAMVTAVNWSSSDEDWASVDEDGLVTYRGPGTAIFTADFGNGTVREFTLTVLSVDETVPVPEEIFPDEEEIHMAVGEQKPFSIGTEPSPARIRQYTYRSENESIVTTGENGVLTATGPGRSNVYVETVSYDENGNEIILETFTTVIVEEGSPALASSPEQDQDGSENDPSVKDEAPVPGDRPSTAWYIPAACVLLVIALAAVIRKRSGRK